MEQLQEELNLTYVFIAHDLSVVKHICDRVAVMYAGKIVELSEAKALFEDPQHPYTKALMSAIPSADPDVKMEFEMPGEVADPANLPAGCSFHPRCSSCFEPCRADAPKLKEIGEARWAACHLY